MKNKIQNKNLNNSRSLGLESYNKGIKKSWLILAVLLLLVFIFMIMAVSLGSAGLTFSETMKALFGFGDKVSTMTIWQIRMPRVVGAIVCGSGLALAGAVMQSCLRNPLASPSTIGVSSAATFGANIAIIGFGAGSVASSGNIAVNIDNPYIVTVCAFGMALLAMLLIMAISKFQNFSAESIILAGTALSAVFSAGTTMMQYFGDETQIAAAVFWTFGDLGDIYWDSIILISIIGSICFIFFMFQAWNYNVIVTGEETAKSLGVKTNVIRVLGLVFSTLLTAVIVSFVGMIGFIGLIGPQIIKRIIGSDHRFFLPASALTGSVILLIADTISRMVISPVVLPIGAITSLLGAPIFIIILLKGLKKK